MTRVCQAWGEDAEECLRALRKLFKEQNWSEETPIWSVNPLTTLVGDWLHAGFVFSQSESMPEEIADID
jgi:hypothetical protein